MYITLHRMTLINLSNTNDDCPAGVGIEARPVKR